MSSSSNSVPADEDTKETFVKCLSAKEIKKLAKPEFAANPDKFYPTKTLREIDFVRAHCSCGNNFWHHKSIDKKTCGDSNCEKRYGFIGTGTGIGRGESGKKISYAEAWEGFSRSLSSSRIPSTPIKRYPVVARWRADVDYVAAGIFCFQPYCVTGELEPPANPLICPQFCLRFNDLDNIGLTGRHYSGFIMLGIQVFNKPNDFKFWMNECVEFNYNWLTKELKIDPREITFIEDVWAGGGNLGPSIEYFISGLELGNMVFMQYKTFPDGSREHLQVQVIDVGIGLERIPWLINGSPTSYIDVFPRALKYTNEFLNLDINNDVWKKFGPLSCLLNVDESEDLEKTWEEIAHSIGLDKSSVKKAIEEVRDLYTVLDHTRTSLMAITDGSLPSNVGGASNIRNILRRVFSLLQKRGWWEKFGKDDKERMNAFLNIFDKHKEDLATIYGPFSEYKSFGPIIELEFNRWKNTDDEQKQKLTALLKKRKDGQLTLDDWIVCVTSYGLPADTVSLLSKQEIPGNLWYEIAMRQETTMKAQPTVLYNTAHLPETKQLFYDNKWEDASQFDGKVLEVMKNATEKNHPNNIVVLNESLFYPTSGGQEHDIGKMIVDGKQYDVVDVLKVGPAVLHVLNHPLPKDATAYVGQTVTGIIDVPRREQLRNHHTGTHIVFAACRRVLGPHVWQQGANKKVDQAHLDITHFQSLTFDQVRQIEAEANRIIQSGKPLIKGYMPKDEAEKKYGFSLYQGGVVPGNTLRVVNIVDTDTEACCGTHTQSTSQVGLIRIFRSIRMSDGIVRLYYVAGERALNLISDDASILNELSKTWSVTKDKLVDKGVEFFEGYKKYQNQAAKQAADLLELQLKQLLIHPKTNLLVAKTYSEAPTLCMSTVPAFAQRLKESGKGAVFIGEGFIYGLFGNSSSLDIKGKLEPFLRNLKDSEMKSSEEKVKDFKIVEQKQVTIQSKDKTGKKNAAAKVDGILQLLVTSAPNQVDPIANFFIANGFATFDSE